MKQPNNDKAVVKDYLTTEQKAREYVYFEHHPTGHYSINDIEDIKEFAYLRGAEDRDGEVEELKGDLAWILRRIRTHVRPENHKFLNLPYFAKKVEGVIEIDLPKSKEEDMEELLEDAMEVMSLVYPKHAGSNSGEVLNNCIERIKRFKNIT